MSIVKERFDLSEAIEETEDLIAMHNVRADELIDIEKYQPSGIGSPKLTSSQTTGTIRSIADLVAFVKSYDKSFSAAPEVSKYVLNDDGTPKVFCHGTDAEFYSFFTNIKTKSRAPMRMI